MTIDDKLPIPNIESIFERLALIQYFTTLRIWTDIYSYKFSNSVQEQVDNNQLSFAKIKSSTFKITNELMQILCERIFLLGAYWGISMRWR